jgi:hypothetical protein
MPAVGEQRLTEPEKEPLKNTHFRRASHPNRREATT